jgi:hypothetical protein
MLETENLQLRALLNLPDADRPKIGSGPTGRGKSLKDGGVPMSERVRARKEARARDRAARGLANVPDSETDSDDMLSPDPSGPPSAPPSNSNGSRNINLPNTNNNNNNNTNNNNSPATAIPLFSNPGDLPAPYSFNLPTPFQLPISPDAPFDYNASNLTNAATGFQIFNMFDAPTNTQNQPSNNQSQSSVHQHQQQQQTPVSNVQESSKPSPMSPNTTAAAAAAQAAAGSPPAQPDLLTRLKACCHLSDSHVVNDPGLLIFATRLCQSYACPFGGAHPGSAPSDDPDQMLLEDAWRNLKATLDPSGDADGENRINTGRMAAELVVRAAASRGNGTWIVCRYKEGMTIRRELVAGLVQGFGGKLD